MADLPEWQRRAIRRAHPTLDVWTLAECADVPVPVILGVLGRAGEPVPLHRAQPAVGRAKPRPLGERQLPPSTWDNA